MKTKKLIITILFSILFFAPICLSAQETESIPPTTKEVSQLTWIQKVERWYENNMNYGTITALMAVESSFIPFPSEIVIPPAAYIASKPNSHLNIYLVVLFGTLGALIGAYFNYFLAYYLGRPVIYKLADSKFGKLIMLSSEKIKRAEDFFNKHGKISTFVGRLITVIRQLISLPAGLARMNLTAFTIYTILGAGIWNVILALVGYIAHGQADLINTYSHELGNIILALFAVIIIWFIVKFFIKRNKKRTAETISNQNESVQ